MITGHNHTPPIIKVTLQIQYSGSTIDSPPKSIVLKYIFIYWFLNVIYKGYKNQK